MFVKYIDCYDLVIHVNRDRLSSFFNLIPDNSVVLSVGIQSAGDSVPKTLWVRILHSAQEDNLSSFRFENRLPVPEHRN